MQVAFPHDGRIRLRLCFTERSLCPAAQPRVRLHLHIRPSAPEQGETAAGRAGRVQCTVLPFGEQADSISVSGNGSYKAIPDQNLEAGSDCSAPSQRESNAAAAAGATYETHVSTAAEQQKASALQFCTAIPENSNKDRRSAIEQHEALATTAEAPAADAGSKGHLLVGAACSMCDIGGVGPLAVAPEPHSMTVVADNQQCGPAAAESPMQGSAGLEASGSAPKLHACKQSAGASSSSLQVLDMIVSSPGCVSPRHMQKQPAALCSYAQVNAELAAQAAAAAHQEGATAYEMTMEPVQLHKEEGDSAPELALLPAGSSATDRQQVPERQPELRSAAVPGQEPWLSGSAGAGHPSSQPAGHLAGPQPLKPLRLVQAEPVEGTANGTTHVTAQLQVIGEGQQLLEESALQVHLVVSLLVLSCLPACAWRYRATCLAHICIRRLAFTLL